MNLGNSTTRKFVIGEVLIDIGDDSSAQDGLVLRAQTFNARLLSDGRRKKVDCARFQATRTKFLDSADLLMKVSDVVRRQESHTLATINLHSREPIGINETLSHSLAWQLDNDLPKFLFELQSVRARGIIQCEISRAEQGNPIILKNNTLPPGLEAEKKMVACRCADCPPGPPDQLRCRINFCHMKITEIHCAKRARKLARHSHFAFKFDKSRGNEISPI
ncbi:hypothetical protein JI59_19955 (plasmid) [Novosphingobium pentaromativorans US6-1]|nr:hypothetical protein JI59_19955 [Novosphingobium pentaromativorans US6-1]